MSHLRRSPSLESFSSVGSIGGASSVKPFDGVEPIDSANSFKSAVMTFPDNLKDVEAEIGASSNDAVEMAASPSGLRRTQLDDHANGPPTLTTSSGEVTRPHKDDSVAAKSTSAASNGDTKKHPRFFLDARTVEFVLDDGTLYRVFRHSLDAHSPTFVSQCLTGRSEDTPVRLSNISAVDFDRFLAMIYPTEPATCELNKPEEWLSVLRLAHKWSFAALRSRAIREIQLAGRAVDKIIVAREFNDLDELQQWLLPAFKEACTAPGWLSTISAGEAERLGAGTVLHIAQIREEIWGAGKGVEAVEKAIVEAGLALKQATGMSLQRSPAMRGEGSAPHTQLPSSINAGTHALVCETSAAAAPSLTLPPSCLASARGPRIGIAEMPPPIPRQKSPSVTFKGGDTVSSSGAAVTDGTVPPPGEDPASLDGERDRPVNHPVGQPQSDPFTIHAQEEDRTAQRACPVAGTPSTMRTSLSTLTSTGDTTTQSTDTAVSAKSKSERRAQRAKSRAEAKARWIALNKASNPAHE